MIQEFSPWLVQRIGKPRIQLPVNFPTLVEYYEQPKTDETRKKNEEAIQKLGQLIPLDYMGSAEYEFGAVSTALRELCQNREELVAVNLEFTGLPYSWETEAKEYSKTQPASSGKVAGWCLKGHEEKLKAFLQSETTGEYKTRLKERTEFQEICFGRISAIRNKNGTPSKRKGYQVTEGQNCALFDLKDYWFVTTDAQQLADLKHILGINL